jgi:methylthioribose-1-phosphate isomerase
MLVNGKNYRTIWRKNNIVYTINQRVLPHRFEIIKLRTSKDIANAIKEMYLRGAPLIGVAGAYGVFLAALEAGKMTGSKFDKYVINASEKIKNTRPTAINLGSSVDNSVSKLLRKKTSEEKILSAMNSADSLADSEITACRKIGEYGFKIIKPLSDKLKRPVNILTHCNAGWLACIDYGTATAPIYLAHSKGINVHIWAEETRPRLQGSNLTAWELLQNNVPHTIITDNAGGYLLSKGMIDMVIVGSDRTTLNGDVCNKIGTYKTALAAKDNNIPFYAAVPVSSFDFSISNGLEEIEIEERNPDEVKYVTGLYKNRIVNVLIAPSKSEAKNYGFDITPSRLVTSLITERGIISPSKKEIKKLI